MFLTKFSALVRDSLFALVYPHACTICGRSVESHELVPACLDCWSSTRIFTGTETTCWKCGLVMESACQVDPTTVSCRKCEDQKFAAARACGVYEGALRESILLLKRRPFVGERLLRHLLTTARQHPLNTATRIVPVPLHPERESQRGFNQASVIVRAIAPYLGLVSDEDNLIRVSAAMKYRTGLDARGRFDSVVGAFEVCRPTLLQGEIILLVDDVLTTGATASSCAVALLAAEARAVYLLTVARPARQRAG